MIQIRIITRLLPALLAGLFACKSTENTTTATTQAETGGEEAGVEVSGDYTIGLNSDSDLYRYEDEQPPPEWLQPEGPYRPEATRHFDLLHTVLDVSFDWQLQRLHGRAELDMKPWFYPQNQVVLDAKNFDIHQVQLVKPGDSTALQFSYDSLKLTVQLDKTYTRNETFKISIQYTAKPEERQTSGSAAISSDKGLYFIDPLDKNPYKPEQIWTQGETEANSCWFPTFDSPNVRTRQEIYITVDTAYTTLSNGKLVMQRDNGNGTRTDYWKQEKPHAPYLFMMAVGKFARVDGGEWNGVPLSYYVEPEYAEFADDVFGNTREMMDFFSELLDYPYPWEKYAQVVVRDFVSGAMENTSTAVFMEQLQVDDRYLLDDNWDQIIAHELFHHWFGNVVTTESWANLPMNESFANYSEYLWLEHKYGEDEAGLMWKEELDTYLFEAGRKRVDLIRYRYLDKENMFDSHSYAKGGLILHLLRHQIGDEAFFESLRRYLKQHEFTSVEVHDLRLIIEEVTGRDMNWFFNQWFLDKGHPQINISHSYDSGKVEMYVKQLQWAKHTPIYEIPTEVAIWVNGEKTVHTVMVDSAENRFVFEVPAEPDLVLFDPDHVIPGEMDFLKPTHEFIFQFYQADNILHKMLSLEELATDVQDPAIKKVFMDALGHDFWRLRELAASAFEDYDGPDKALIAERLKAMALNDPKSLVRATAVGTLASFGAQYLPVAEQALQDSSYLVQATALYAYANLGGPEPVARMESMEDTRDITLMATLADFYSYYGVPDKLDWFANKIERESGQELALLVNYLGIYLLNRPVEARAQGLQILKGFFNSDYPAQVKAAAYRSLNLLSDMEGITALLEEIKTEETNPEALRMYNMFSQD